MKCFVHFGSDPEPKEAKEPETAIAIAEKYLVATDQNLSIKWRRDDLYPYNFVDYTKDQVAEFLQKNGEVVLQLANIQNNDLVVMGEVANIYTDDEEEKNIKEAEEALNSQTSILRRKLKKYIG